MISIRKATLGDERAIATIDIESVGASRRGLFDDTYLDGRRVEDSISGVRTALTDPDDNHVIWVAEDAAEIVAFAETERWRADAREGIAYLANLYVHPTRFRQGIGSELLRFVEEHLQSAGFQAVLAWVVQEAQATRAFYAAQGWAWQGETKWLTLDRPRVVELWSKVLA